MKDESKNKNMNIDSEWSWINKNSVYYNQNNLRNFFGHERIRITFSDKLDENTENFTIENTQTDYYKNQVSKQSANRNESDKSEYETHLSENPGKEIDNPQPDQKPEIEDGSEIKKIEVDKKQFENENNEESLVKEIPVEGVNMEEDKKETGIVKEEE